MQTSLVSKSATDCVEHMKSSDSIAKNIQPKDKDKLFFYSMSTSLLFCRKEQTKEEAWAAQFDDIHTQRANRLNGLLKLTPAFAKAFDCGPSDPMAFTLGHRCARMLGLK